MEVALDDYIKTKNITRKGTRGGLGTGRGGAKPGRGRGGQKNLRSPRMSRGIGKKPIGRSFGASRAVSRTVLANGDRWQHDLFGASGAVGRGLRTSGGGAAKLLISNLDFGVSDTDISDLFSEFGQLKKASVHYDRSGRSIGTAEVIFARASDAMSAMRKYNGVPLDGRSMDIQLVTSGPGGVNSPSPQSRIGGGRGRTNFSGRARGARGGATRGRGGRGGGRGGARRTAKPEVTQEQLDMELDEYQASANNTA